jgi:hypothetical protein
MKYFVLAIIFLLTACATMTEVPGRLYNLDDATIITVTFNSFSYGHGKSTARMPGGEMIRGEYTISRQALKSSPMAKTSEPPPGSIEFDRGKSVPSENEPGWSEVYGIASGARATPLGTGTLVGDKGTIIQIVFYMVDLDEGTADGVARSNAGAWYRVHLGKLKKDGT